MSLPYVSIGDDGNNTLKNSSMNQELGASCTSSLSSDFEMLSASMTQSPETTVEQHTVLERMRNSLNTVITEMTEIQKKITISAQPYKMTSSHNQAYLDFLATSVFKSPFETTWRAPLSEEQWEALQNMELPFCIPKEERSAAEKMEVENALRSSCTGPVSDGFEVLSSSHLGLNIVAPNRNGCTGEVSVRKEELASIRNSLTKVLGDLNGMKSMLNGLWTTG